MDNFQLYKTSPLLGGQLKWDLILGSVGSKLYVKDFHLTPISSRVPYNRYSYDNLLNYSHQENVKRFYKEIESSFYQDYVDPNLTHDWPIITEENIKPYDDTFFMGCQRSLYQLYGKQFEFFIPLWLENIKEGDSLVLNININNKNGQTILSKTLELSEDVIENEYHNKFCSYLKNYFQYIKIYNTDKTTDVININLSNKTAYITGLDASIGELVTRDISSLVTNLLSRERPLLEFDSMITNSIQNNKLILKQLFNFNLCFNIEDIVSNVLMESIYGSQISIGVDVKIKNGSEIVPLEKRDIYTNFEYIPRTKLSPIWEDPMTPPNLSEGEPSNVLDYLKDNQCVDLILSNKIVQKIPHWQLENNSDYIFNVYNGFTCEYDGVKTTSHYYNETPNIEQKTYSESLNNIGWANASYMSVATFNNILSLPVSYLEFLTNLKGWANNLYYNTQDDVLVGLGLAEKNNIDNRIILGDDDKRNYIVEKLFDDNDDLKDIYIGYNKVDNNELKQRVFVVLIKYEETDNKDNKRQFNLSNLTFANIKDLLIKEINDGKEQLTTLLNAMKSVQSIPIVTFNKSLYVLNCDSPSLSSTEIEYYKKDSGFSEYILRYDGKIKPNFIQPSDQKYNYIYSKYYSPKDSLDKSFTKYLNTGYTPKFPSINYCSLNRSKLNYNKSIYEDDDKKKLNINNLYEIKWFNDSEILMLKSHFSKEININDINNDGSISLNELNKSIEKIIKDFYNLVDDEVSYVVSQYNITYDLQETSFENNSTIFKYIVNFNLK